MPNTTLSLWVVVDVTVEVSPIAAASPTFNQGLIVGNSAIIPNATRLREYSALSQVAADGFSLSSPEYLSAQLYFGQSPAPQYLWIGLQDTTAIQTIILNSSAGTGYVVGDILSVVQAGASGGTLLVTAVGSGVPTTLQIRTQGTGYSVAAGLPTSGGTGTGCEVNITAIGETPLQALQACRNANGAWWTCMSTTAGDADHIAIAPWIQAATPPGTYIACVQDTTVLATLQTGDYGRILSIDSTTQSGLFPSNAYGAAAVMGSAMGLNTGLAGSYFTMKFKKLSGIAVEPLTQSQVTAIEALNGNLYLSYANTYSWLEQGVMANGQYFDEVLALDMLASDIQYSLVNLLISLPSIPQNNSGEAQLIAAVNSACERSKTRGFISPGTWNGQTVLNLTAGTALPNGYLTQADSYANQSTGDRQARKAMPIYCAVLESGAVHSLIVGIYVQR